MLQKIPRAYILSFEQLCYSGTELLNSISCDLSLKTNLWGNLKDMNTFPYIDKRPDHPLMQMSHLFIYL